MRSLPTANALFWEVQQGAAAHPGLPADTVTLAKEVMTWLLFYPVHHVLTLG